MQARNHPCFLFVSFPNASTIAEYLQLPTLSISVLAATFLNEMLQITDISESPVVTEATASNCTLTLAYISLVGPVMSQISPI